MQRAVVVFFLIVFLVACDKQFGAAGLSSVGKKSNATAPVLLDGDGASSEQWYVSQYCASNEKNWKPEFEMPEKVDGGIYELTQWPEVDAAEADYKVAGEMVEEAWLAAVENGWLDKQKALDDGFELLLEDKIHFAKREFIFDGQELNPNRPEFLMYYKTDVGDLLMGAMFLSVGRGEQVAGPLSVWHYHIGPLACYIDGIYPIDFADENGSCSEGVAQRKTVEMLHLWFFDHPEGVFATKMHLEKEHQKLAKRQILERYKKAGYSLSADHKKKEKTL